MDILLKKTDLQLVKLAKKGNRHAFDILITRYQPKVISLLSRYVNDQAEARDLSQDVFMRVYQALEDFRGESKFYTWLYRVAINIAKNNFIHNGRQPDTISVDFDDPMQVAAHWVRQDSETPEDCVASQEMEESLVGVIHSLPDELKIVFVLREIEGFSYEEIADLLDCPLGTIRSRLHRVRAMIDKGIEE
jgi:RNA polymerase sigma-70 factor, ECF subfamily